MAKRKFWMTISFALLSFFGASAAQSAPVIYGNYYHEILYAQCLGKNECRMVFSKTPSGKYLTITNASCNISTTMLVYSIDLLVASSPTSTPGLFASLNANPRQVRAGFWQYTLNTNVNLKMTSQRFPMIYMNDPSGGDYYMSCSITGNLSNS